MFTLNCNFAVVVKCFFRIAESLCFLLFAASIDFVINALKSCADHIFTCLIIRSDFEYMFLLSKRIINQICRDNRLILLKNQAVVFNGLVFQLINCLDKEISFFRRLYVKAVSITFKGVDCLPSRVFSGCFISFADDILYGLNLIIIIYRKLHLKHIADINTANGIKRFQ